MKKDWPKVVLLCLVYTIVGFHLCRITECEKQYNKGYKEGAEYVIEVVTNHLDSLERN